MDLNKQNLGSAGNIKVHACRIFKKKDKIT